MTTNLDKYLSWAWLFAGVVLLTVGFTLDYTLLCLILATIYSAKQDLKKWSCVQFSHDPVNTQIRKDRDEH